MLLKENIIDKFRFHKVSNLILEGLSENEMKEQKKQLDETFNGKSSIKILTHVDMDGYCSAITLYRYALSKGIKPNNIVIEFGQYGDRNNKLKISSTPSGKSQGVIVSDFAKLPTERIWNLFQQSTGFKASERKQQIVAFCNSRDFSKMSEEEFKNLYKKFPIVSKEQRNENTFSSLYTALKKYSELKNRKQNPIQKITVDNIENYRQQTSNPDYEVDHHDNSNDNLRAGDRGVIGVECPSNAGMLAEIFGGWSQDDIDAINMIDSAGYKEDELIDTVFLNGKANTTESKKLAIIINSCIEQASKKDKGAAIRIVKNSACSLKSLYQNLKEAQMINSKKMEMLTALKKKSGTEAAQEISKLSSELPDDVKNGGKSKKKKFNGLDRKLFDPDSHYYRNREGKPISKMADENDIREKNKKNTDITKTGYLTRDDKKELENITSKGDLATPEEKIRKTTLENRKGHITSCGPFAMLSAKDFSELKTYPSRYVASLYTVKGQRFPYSIKRYSDFIQAAKNPLFKEEPGKPKLDFSKVAPHVYNDVKNELKKRVNNKEISKWTYDQIVGDMEFNSGGHGAIFSIQGFDNLKLTGQNREKFYKASDFIKRAEAVTKANRTDKKDVKAAKKERYNQLTANKQKVLDDFNSPEGALTKINNLKQDIMDLAIKSIIKWTCYLYPISKEDMDRLKTDNKDFEDESK